MPSVKHESNASGSTPNHRLIPHHSGDGLQFSDGQTQAYYVAERKMPIASSSSASSSELLDEQDIQWQVSCSRCGKVLQTMPDTATDNSGTGPASKNIVSTIFKPNGTGRCTCHTRPAGSPPIEQSEVAFVNPKASLFEESLLEDGSSVLPKQQRPSSTMKSLLGADACEEREEQETKKVAHPSTIAPSKQSGCPFSGKRELRNIRLKNYFSSTQQNDTLHRKAKASHCSEPRCMGSLMQPYGGGDQRPYGVPRPKDEVKIHAVEFFDEYYAHLKQKDSTAHKERLANVFAEVDKRGTYDLTYNELVFGAKMAWRNAPRCIGRIQWNNLKVFDARSVNTPEGVFAAICQHMDYATNEGNLRSTITIFRERREGEKDFRLWNAQLIKYAGYEQKDGSIIGDPTGVAFTMLCEKLGWRGAGTKFDVLPLVIECHGEKPVVFDIPKHLILEVNIKHPDYPWFEELGLKWYALPAVANMKFDVGGVEFPCAPFNGWYMVTEVGARDLGDSARYNMLEPIAKKMNLNTKSPTSLWKDRAVTELNQAVLYSFQEAKTTMVDHHTASNQFINHMQNEHKLRGGCPADWVWIVPPSNGSTTEVFHQEMLNYTVKPSYDYQDDAWMHYQFEDEVNKKRLTFQQAAILVRATKFLMNSIMAKRQKATVLYATETGKSESFARTLTNLLSRAFDVQVFCMDEYDFSRISKENLLMIVTSTFGNGEAPMNGEQFGGLLYKLGHQSTSATGKNAFSQQGKALTGIKYAVFGLGSSAYPNFCAFAHSCRDILHQLGGNEIHPIGEGDELRGQEDSFKKWAKSAFKAACTEFSIDESKLYSNSEESIDSVKEAYDPKKYTFAYDKADTSLDVLQGLSRLHNKDIQEAKCISVEELQSKKSSRSTVLVRLDRNGNSSLNFQPGDHLSVFPSNDANMVEKLICQLKNAPDADSSLKIKKLNGASDDWEVVSRLPSQCSLRQALTSYLDITSPPSQEILGLFANLAEGASDAAKLRSLSQDSHAYEDWKCENFPTITEILEDFPSLKLNGVELLTQLPILQPRYYSISSSPLLFPNEIHATVAVVRYETEGKQKRMHDGVCSGWMSKLNRNDVVPCYMRQAPSFRLPTDLRAPVIMVGPGSGIAPLRSFWQHRQKQREMEESKDVEWGSMDLYAGCRAFEEDNIYQEEKQQLVNAGTLDHAFLALSREPGVKKTYVQDLIASQAREIYSKIVNQSGHMYVCGDVAMAAGVSDTLCRILQEKVSFTKTQAKEFIKKMKSSGHYHEDIFGVTKIRSRTSKE